ncbi:diacylglycerol kinase family protein [uncultured Microbacterium sp.]|uniref:diacylglycerol/lipid kinase family protein n=1 Tax=uncultured Microbacterium sp. TaxID=191216 RepID=UPI0025DD4383|nr:diacylglycerol kinase family protein [uncultured Microbacterium sp.]
MPTISLIANPSAGKGRAAAATETAVAALRAAGADVQVLVGGSVAQTRASVDVALREPPRAIVVVGGDGTVSAILPRLVGASVPLVLVPAGTGNDLARALGLPLHDPAGSALLALHGVPRRIDVGEIVTEGRVVPFLTVAALGFDAKVSDRTNRLRWPRGAARYYLAILVELARLRPTRFRIAIEGSPMRDAPGTLIAVGNTTSYGGGMRIAPSAALDDGLLDVVHVGPLRRGTLMRLFPELLRGRHLARPEVTHQRVSEIVVEAPDLVVYADGERIAEKQCAIRVRPGALTMQIQEGE